jgi:hypothetical protein
MNISFSTQPLEATPQLNINNISKFDNYTFTTSTPVINLTEVASRKRREDIATAKDDFDSLSISAYDGFLDEKANYTAFVEIIGKIEIKINEESLKLA